MKDLTGTATARVAATPEECVALLAEVERYPSWHPDVVRYAEVLERGPDGVPARARTKVHVVAGPLVKDFDFVVAVSVEPGREVRLERVPHQAGDSERFELRWLIESGPETVLHIALDARLSVPRFVPLGGVGDSIAQGFVDAASRALEGSSPNAAASSS